jgi:hypothetical protein
VAERQPQHEDIDVAQTFDRKLEIVFDVDRERMHLARWVLLGLFILSLVTFYTYVYQVGEQSKAIFDFYKVAVPPIVTLILGAYFKHGRD